jgi:hypothetical protein
MAGRKYGVVIHARTPATYQSMSAAEQAKAGKAFESVQKKYAGRVDQVRRYWTSAFTHDTSDVFILEADDPALLHAFQEDLDRAMAKAGGDPTRFGQTVHITFGLNPDAEALKPARASKRSR